MRQVLPLWISLPLAAGKWNVDGQLIPSPPEPILETVLVIRDVVYTPGRASNTISKLPI